MLHSFPEQQAGPKHQTHFVNPLEADGLDECWELIFLLLSIHNLYVSESSEVMRKAAQALDLLYIFSSSYSCNSGQFILSCVSN